MLARPARERRATGAASRAFTSARLALGHAAALTLTRSFAALGASSSSHRTCARAWRAGGSHALTRPAHSRRRQCAPSPRPAPPLAW
jgi:hypothetical protein